MPAARQQQAGTGLVAYLNSLAPVRPVNQTIRLAHYYHSADLLKSQAAAYRAAHNQEQLYVMLFRLVSLVQETIPKHNSCDTKGAEYQQYVGFARAAMGELEQLRLVLQLRDSRQPQARTLSRPAQSVRITDTNAIRDIDWDGAAAPPPPSAPPAPAATAAAAAASPGLLDLGADLEWPPRAASAPAAPAPASSSASAGSAGSGGWEPVTYSASYAPRSEQLVQKHSLFGPRSSGARPLQQQSSGGSGRVRYPAFDSSPIDALWAQPPASGSGSSSSAAAAAAAGVGGLSLGSSQQQQGSLLDAPLLPAPSAGPSLGPQEVAVQGMSACGGQPGGTCAQPPPPPGQQQQPQSLAVVPVGAPSAAEAAAAAAAGPKPLSKRLDLRDVHISVALMNDFLHYAASNTRRGIESCGILAGRLSASDSLFTVSTLIVPKQTGTSDTVEMLGEEEVWEAESSRELVPLGWIHTHPTQSCFLSSVDIHTQCGYQTMLDEAVAIVMAPTDSRNKCGIFRLTTPAGLGHVQRCGLRGFHASCNSEVYELCGHVYLNPGAKHEVIDLR